MPDVNQHHVHAVSNHHPYPHTPFTLPLRSNEPIVLQPSSPSLWRVVDAEGHPEFSQQVGIRPELLAFALQIPPHGGNPAIAHITR
jgi:hypothetical protein